MSSNIITYLSLYQTFSHVLVLFCTTNILEHIEEDMSFRCKHDRLFQILLKIERTAILLSKLSRSWICHCLVVFYKCKYWYLWSCDPPGIKTSWRRRSDVCRRYVSNETPNDVSMERCEDVSMVRLYDVLLESRNDVSKGCNNDAPSLRLHDVSNKSQMKHPTTSR